MAHLGIIFFFCLIAQIAQGAGISGGARQFELFKLNEGSKPTMLLMGGIHGDEPGAYYASDFFLRHYKITKGSVWVVPIVNPHSMFANVRGLYGDMNRKFAHIADDDPDYEVIQAIKTLLAQKDIDISLHLHDGSGYWRPQYINSLLNQHRWGNCSVIDQPNINGAKYGDIQSIVAQMVADINAHIHIPMHKFHINNTDTKASNNIEQLKALTFFSLSLGKPALTNEASKELALPTRVYYHLLAIESLLGQLGIEFERDFDLSQNAIIPLLAPSLFRLEIEDKITLPIQSLRPALHYFPLPKNTPLQDIKLNAPSRLFGLVRGSNGALELKYGAKTLSVLSPQWQEFDKDKKHIEINIDGEIRRVNLGSVVFVKEFFEILPLQNHRVNVIGYTKHNDNAPKPNESGIRIYQKDIMDRYSLDTHSKIYRAEVYNGEHFSGMISIIFGEQKPPKTPIFQAVRYKPAKAEPTQMQIAQNATPPTPTALPASSTPLASTQIKSPKDFHTQSRPESQMAESSRVDSRPTNASKIESSRVDSRIIDSKARQNAESRGDSRKIDSRADSTQPSAESRANTQVADSRRESQGADSKSAESRLDSQGADSSGADAVFVVIAARGVNVRNAPNISSKILKTLPKGTKIAIESIKGKWGKIKESENYVILSALSKDSARIKLAESSIKADSKPTSHDTQANVLKARVIVNLAMVRENPSLNANIIAKAPRGREMEIVRYIGDEGVDGSEWVQIHYVFNGRNIDGYIARRLIQEI